MSRPLTPDEKQKILRQAASYLRMFGRQDNVLLLCVRIREATGLFLADDPCLHRCFTAHSVLNIAELRKRLETAKVAT